MKKSKTIRFPLGDLCQALQAALVRSDTQRLQALGDALDACHGRIDPVALENTIRNAVHVGIEAAIPPLPAEHSRIVTRESLHRALAAAQQARQQSRALESTAPLACIDTALCALQAALHVLQHTGE